MFNFSFGELLLLGVIGLIVIGPKQLPQVAKILARTVGEFKKAINDVKSSVAEEMKTDIFKDDKKIVPPKAIAQTKDPENKESS